MKRFDMLEDQAIRALLATVPRGFNGGLPFDRLSKLPEWQVLAQGGRTEASIRTKLHKVWRESLIPIPPAPAPAAAATPARTDASGPLNHAFNFCPACGFKLNL